ncbi:MAG TPA: MDR family MFS transporter [Acidocella sp.]|jgi:EmrB/QacA subfamily drug resistance transporter|uniref:MDR family MFS transporter n=1 Tax=Acidocella sp. TaxID=50710 RepID=UPI002C237FD6|nr:MDR family MFS transporter [Acidocella sp.]HVE23639.1 MDR family MFS transporter [Acidocella sp.]
MASMVMVAIEATIVSTAMPQIVAQLGGLRLYSWVFSSFLLTQTAATVVFGKLSDLYGRKHIMLLGIAIFLVGSVLAGCAWSMPSMIVFRLIQGMGAGAVQPVGLTIVADLYPARERGKIQGYISSLWAVSAVLGPIVGGLILRDFSWAWIFWINVPIGLAAAAGFMLFLHDSPKHERRSIDIAGAALFTVAIASLLIALTETGTSHGETVLLMTGLFAVSAILFLLQERRAADPMISFALWSRRPIAVANAVAVFSGMALIGLTTFLPMYMQSVLHQSAVISGLTLTMVLVGWPVGSMLAARLFHRVGLRSILIVGSTLMPAGAAAFVLLNPQSSLVTAALGSLVMGLGMGLVSIGSLILIQEIVDWAQRGSVTASNLFARNLGSTLGATALGAVLNYGLSHAKGVRPITSDQLRQLLAAPHRAAGGGDMAVGLALQQSLHLTFWAILGISVVIVGLAVLVPPVRIGQAEEVPAE